MFTAAVNIMNSVNIDPGEDYKMPPWLIRQLRGIEGLTAVQKNDSLQLGMAGGSSAAFIVEAKSRLSLEGAQTIARDAEARSSRILVATRSLTSEARRVLRAHDISWVERDTKACWIQSPGILIERSPSDPVPERQSSATLSRATKLQKKSGVVAESLLLFYRDGAIKVRDVADTAGVAVGLVSRVLRRLENEEIVASQGLHAHKHRQLVNPAKLLDLWRDEERAEGWSREGLYVWSQTSQILYSRLHDLSEAGLRWALGHSSAANRYTPTLTREPDPEIWVPARVPPEQVADILDGELVESGANLAVWQCPDDSPLHYARSPASIGDNRFPMVSRYRAYLEAFHRGGRFQDVATRLRNELDLSDSGPTS